MPEPLIKISQISKTYRTRSESRQVLEKVSLNIDAEDRIAFVGPNGSGKTTLLRILLGIDTADEGTAKLSSVLDGHAIGYVPQDYRNALFPWLRLHANLALANGACKNGDSIFGELSKEITDSYRRFSEVFRVGLDLEKYPYQLSGGEQQMFLLIRALIQKPKLLVLDEPLSAVDFGRRRYIQHFLVDLIHDTKCTLLFASHDFEEAVMLSNRVIVLSGDSGELKKIIEVDLPWPRTAEVKSDPRFDTAVEAIISTVL
jgi:NitT/TauT family transport system ATP-binding protein